MQSPQHDQEATRLPSQGTEGWSTTRQLWAQVAGLLALSILVPLLLVLDTDVLAGRMSESSATEVAQSLLVALSAFFCAMAARQMPLQRRYLVMLATLFAMMLIRESDAVFDEVYHGFWVVPALVTLAIGLLFAWRSLPGLRAALGAHVESRQGTMMLTGVIFLIFFSRLFGTGAVWEAVMGESYDPLVKAAVQEGLELMAYALIALGAWLSYMGGFGADRARGGW